MKKHLLLLLFVLLVTVKLKSQIVQKGVVYELNSKKTPMAGVQVIFKNAPPTDSDGNGRFNLHFVGPDYGDKIAFDKIYKAGYEIVNETELLAANLNKQELTVIICKNGVLNDTKSQYYQVSIKEIEKRYDVELAILKNKLQKASIKESAFYDEVNRLNNKLSHTMQQVDELSSKFARINLDDASEDYKQAFELFKKGEIDGAIKLINGVEIIKQIYKRQKEGDKIKKLKLEVEQWQSENNAAIKNDIDALKLAIDLSIFKMDYDNANFLFYNLWLTDTTNTDVTYDYATFLIKNDYRQQAVKMFLKTFEMPFDEGIKANISSYLGQLYSDLGDFDSALNMFQINNTIYKKLHNSNNWGNRYKLNYAISFQWLGNVYYDLENYEKALFYYKEFNKLIFELAETTNPPKHKSVLLTSYSHLGKVYNKLKDEDNYIDFTIKSYKLAKELYIADSVNIQNIISMALESQHMGDILHKNNEILNSLSLYLEQKRLFELLTNKDPRNTSYQFSLGLAYQFICASLHCLGRYVEAKEYAIEYNSILIKISQKYPEVLDYRRGLAISYLLLGENFRLLNDYNAAINMYEEYLTKNVGFNKLYPDRLDFKTSMALAYKKIGYCYLYLNDNVLSAKNYELAKKCYLECFNKSRDKYYQKEVIEIDEILSNI